MSYFANLPPRTCPRCGQVGKWVSFCPKCAEKINKEYEHWRREEQTRKEQEQKKSD